MSKPQKRSTGLLLGAKRPGSLVLLFGSRAQSQHEIAPLHLGVSLFLRFDVYVLGLGCKKHLNMTATKWVEGVYSGDYLSLHQLHPGLHGLKVFLFRPRKHPRNRSPRKHP